MFGSKKLGQKPSSRRSIGVGFAPLQGEPLEERRLMAILSLAAELPVPVIGEQIARVSHEQTSPAIPPAAERVDVSGVDLAASFVDFRFGPGEATRTVNVSYDPHGFDIGGGGVHGWNGAEGVLEYTLPIPVGYWIKSVWTELDYGGGYGQGNYIGKGPKGAEPGLGIRQEISVGMTTALIDRLELTTQELYGAYWSPRAPSSGSSYSTEGTTFDSPIATNSPVRLRIITEANTVTDVGEYVAHVELAMMPQLFDDPAEIRERLAGTVEVFPWIQVDDENRQYAFIDSFLGSANEARQFVADLPTTGIRLAEPRNDRQFAATTQIAAGRGYLVGMQLVGGRFRWDSDNSEVTTSYWGTYTNWRGEVLPEPNDDDGSATAAFAQGNGLIDDDDPTRLTRLQLERATTIASVSSVNIVSGQLPGQVTLRLGIDGTNSAAAVGALSMGGDAQYFVVYPGQNEVQIPLQVSPGLQFVTVGIVGVDGKVDVRAVPLFVSTSAGAEQVGPVYELDEGWAAIEPSVAGVYAALYLGRAELAGVTLAIASDYPEILPLLSMVDSAHRLPTSPGEISLDFGLRAMGDPGDIPEISTLYITADYEEHLGLKKHGWDRFVDGLLRPFEAIATLFTDPGKVLEGIGDSLSAFFRNPIEYVGSAFEALATPEGLGSLLTGSLIGAIPSPITSFVQGLQNPLGTFVDFVAPALGTVGEVAQAVTQFIMNPVGGIISVIGDLASPEPHSADTSELSRDSGTSSNELLLPSDDYLDNVGIVGLFDQSDSPFNFVGDGNLLRPSGLHSVTIGDSLLATISIFDPTLPSFDPTLEIGDPLQPEVPYGEMVDLGENLVVVYGPAAFTSQAALAATAFHEGFHVAEAATGIIDFGLNAIADFDGRIPNPWAELAATEATITFIEKNLLLSENGLEELTSEIGYHALALNDTFGGITASLFAVDDAVSRVKIPTLVENRSGHVIYIKPEDGTSPYALAPGHIFIGADGTYDPVLQLGRPFKIIDGTHAVIYPDGAVVTDLIFSDALVGVAPFVEMPLSIIFDLAEQVRGAGLKDHDWLAITPDWKQFVDLADKVHGSTSE